MAAERAIKHHSTIKSIVKSYSSGMSLTQLAEKHNVSPSTVRAYLLREGVEMRPRGRRVR